MVSSALSVLASDDCIGFSFTIKSYGKNVRVSQKNARYRQTTNVNNPWKVNLQSSGEGAGTCTKFWMENYSGDNVTKSYNVYVNDTIYRTAKSSASMTTCFLAAQNNNYNSSTYSVTGIWDEETY